MSNKETNYFKYIYLLVFCVLVLIYNPMEINAESSVNIRSFGSIPNDNIDDTNSIQNAIDFQNKNGGGIVYFEKGEYLIDAIQSIILKDNITLEFELGTILKAIPNSGERYEIIKIHDVKNIKLIGQVSIVGDRNEHLGSSGEWGSGISIRGSRNVYIKDVNVSDMWGDGIYVGNTSKQNYSEDIKIINSTLNNNRRQGITIVSARNLEILDAVITNTNGTSPQCGIDIEPNNPTQFLENIKIINLKTSNNEGSGLKLYLEKFKFNEKPISIFVDSIYNIKDGFAIRSLENTNGSIEIAKYQYLVDKDSLIAPTVEPVTNISEAVVGKSPEGSFITISVGDRGLGKAQTNINGEYKVPIPVQLANAIMRVRVSDAHGNYVSNKYVTVLNAKYSDFKMSHWAHDEVVYLAGKQIITGYPNGNFQPNKNTTRSEAAKMLAIALNLPIKDVSSGYKDVKANYWAKNYIAAVSKAGLFNGNPDGTFAPNDVLKRSEMAKVISIAYNLNVRGNNYFSDVKNNHWAKSYISGLYESRVTTGFPDKTYRPEEPTTRSEYSAFLARAMNEKFR